MLVLKTNRACTDLTLPILKRDTLLETVNGGVPWLIDLASSFSYPSQLAPVNGAVVKNLDESGNDGSVVVQAGDAPSFAGSGIDFTGITKAGNHVTGPAAAAASIWGSANQYFIVCAYMKLPTLANWNLNGNAVFDMLKFAATHYIAGPELVLIGQQGASSSFTFRRQTAAGAADVLTVIPAAGDYGSFAQVSFWRDAGGQHARLKTANGAVLANLTANANNTQNFSALTPQFGVPGGLAGGVGGVMAASQQNAAKFRIYRAFVENLVVSGRDATTVLDADYTRTVARGVFS